MDAANVIPAANRSVVEAEKADTPMNPIPAVVQQPLPASTAPAGATQETLPAAAGAASAAAIPKLQGIAGPVWVQLDTVFGLQEATDH